jgi:hypothetical protein
MKPQTFLGHIITCLTSHGTDYVLTGSVAVAWYGRPRILKDFDIVLRAPIPATTLETTFPAPHFSVLSDECTLLTLSNRISIVECTFGWRAELFFAPLLSPADRQFSLMSQYMFESPFGCRRRCWLAGREAWVSSPEYLLLIKLMLCTYKEDRRPKDWQDAVYIYLLQSAQLDFSYMDHWAAQLHVQPLWQRLQEEARLP